MRPPRPRLSRLVLLIALLALPVTAHASEGGHGPAAEVWLTLAFILLAAKLGGELALRLKQPPVLGELTVGIILGNLSLLGGFEFFEHAEHMEELAFLAELGVVLLLFEVGLESTLTEMRKVAPQSGMVAILGVVAPIGLGYGASYLLIPGAPMSLHLFVGATLCATSVGITARVLKDIDAMARPETNVILGAAVIDDVLGLIVLAVVVAIAEQGTMPSGLELAQIIGLATGFLVGALILGAYVMPGVFKFGSKLRTGGVLGAMAIGLAMLLSGLSAAAGLAAIVGAFAAGLILDEVHVRPFGKHSSHDLAPLVAPIVAVMAPIFFVRTGMMVDLGAVDSSALLLALALTVVAIVGKLVAGIGVRGGAADKLAVGIGMVPRGEVGLIFAAKGAAVMVAGVALITPGVYSAIVLMVMATTIIAPPWLAGRLLKTAPAAQKAALDGDFNVHSAHDSHPNVITGANEITRERPGGA